jgi:hypothetical protein
MRRTGTLANFLKRCCGGGEVCSAAEKYEKGGARTQEQGIPYERSIYAAVSNGVADLPVTPLPTLMSLCIIGSSTCVFILQVFYVRFEVSFRYLSALLFLCPACFGLLFILVAHLGGCQSQHIVEAHNSNVHQRFVVSAS